jgi:hypothetical protein
MNAIASLLLTSLFFYPTDASAQSVDNEPEPAEIFELGCAAGWGLNGGRSSFGGDLAIEFTPIEKWLEIEAGTTLLFRRHSTEWDTDILFKKPWTLSEEVEFMLGVGPEWIHTKAFGVTTNALGGEVVMDFMFWPSSKHRFGWFLEPAYEQLRARARAFDWNKRRPADRNPTKTLTFHLSTHAKMSRERSYHNRVHCTSSARPTVGVFYDRVE